MGISSHMLDEGFPFPVLMIVAFLIVVALG